MIKVERERTGLLTLDLATIKLWLKVDGNADDALITDLIEQSADLIESYCNRSFADTSIILTASARTEMQLPYLGDSYTITSVTDYDAVDIDYEDNKMGQITMSYNDQDFIIDYEVTAIQSSGLLLAQKEIIAYLYENRGDASEIQMMLTQNKNLQIFRNLVWI